MVDMQYDADGLARGADGHRHVSDTAELVATTLSQLPSPSGGLGTVPTAAAFATALDQARFTQAQTAVREAAEGRRALAERVGRTAGLGNAATTQTTTAAQGIAGMLGPSLTAGDTPGAGSGSIASQMGGRVPASGPPVAGPGFTPASILEGMN